MTKRASLPLLLLIAVLLAATACGGSDEAASDKPVLTDPASVPTATPIQSAVLYQLRGREIIVGGVSTEVAGGPTPIPRTYTVAPGDTCAQIAAKLDIPVDELMRSNRTINSECTNLRPGDILRVPAGALLGNPTPTPRSGSVRTYTVQDGDTCSGIAQSFEVTVDALIAANGLDADCRTLQVGQVLDIP